MDTRKLRLVEIQKRDRANRDVSRLINIVAAVFMGLVAGFVVWSVALVDSGLDGTLRAGPALPYAILAFFVIGGLTFLFRSLG